MIRLDQNKRLIASLDRKLMQPFLRTKTPVYLPASPTNLSYEKEKKEGKNTYCHLTRKEKMQPYHENA